MKSKNIRNKEFYKELSKPTKGPDLCEVSKASTEIMLDRFCNGKEADFPFSG